MCWNKPRCFTQQCLRDSGKSGIDRLDRSVCLSCRAVPHPQSLQFEVYALIETARAGTHVCANNAQVVFEGVERRNRAKGSHARLLGLNM